jgi:hypothetical protein
MNIEQRLRKIEKSFQTYKQAEIIFKGRDESEEEALKRGRATYPGAGLIILVKWISAK